MYEHNHSSASTIPSTSDNRNNASFSGSSEGRQLQQPQSQSAPSNPTITPIEKGNSTVANAGSRRSITEGVCCVTSSPSTSKQQSPPAVSVDCISITGSESRLSRYSARLESGEGPTGDSHHQPTHYGSSSTTFSTGSSNLTGSSFGTAGLSLDQTSEASSSGVATMSSTDHLPITMALSRSSVDDSTPTMSTLTGGGTAAELRRELEPILYDAASTMIPGGGAFDIPAISSLSLNSAPTNGSSATKARVSSDTATTDSSANPSLLLTSQNQAQSTPSLLWTYTANSINCPNVSSSHKRQTARHGSKLSSMISGVAKSKVKTALGPTEQQQKEMKTAKVANSGDKKREGSGSSREKSSAKTSSSTIGDESTQQLPANMETPSATLVANQQLDQNIVIPAPPHSSSPTASHHSLLGSSPLPSVFNCAATSCSQIICTPLRTIVSQNRRRYQMDGFNLDLTYITDRIIAMGYPADTKEALYRNSMSHIVKFLEHYHPGHYKVFNLRGQYVYDPANFHNRVVSFEMTDHHPPRLELMAPFCREVHDYLEADPLNVVAVHCKAGKGRTGVMICAYLCYIAFYRTPRQNMDYYSIIRTHNNKGVTIPSQRRYVYYFAHLRERQLNYMPLRCELVGIYLERPPKLCGPFSKGALKVRVASGDVDVFLGDDMWLNGEQYEEEEELHRRYPLMAGGDDQYDPMQPAKTNDNCGRNCISRRCYGWTVPENKRVFLEGDIRVDIFQKSRLKLFNVKQERKKIGHIWFNTMFTCPGFCGGQYVHGDEAYPYPESMIVRRRFKRKQQAKDTISQREEEQSTAREDIGDANTQILNSGNSNFSSTPALSAHHPASAPSIAATENSSADEGTGGKDQLQPREKSGSLRFGGIKLANGMTSISGNGKKRSARSPCRQLIESDQKSWHSQDGELSQHRVAPGIVSSAEKQPMPPRKQCRSSLDTAESEYEEEIVVEKPPGLDKHCSAELLRGIYPNEKLAPRFGIEEIIRDAFQKNLINDIYNARRMSQPRDGPLIPKASIDRPKAGGPNCLMRKSDEHVGTFGVQEIDRAYKNKDIDLGFKVFVLTRCIDESNPCDLRLADQFIRVTHQKQTQKEREKLEKMQQKHRKLMQQAHKQTNAQIHGVNDNKKGTDPEIGGPMLEFGIVDVEQLQTAEEAGECSTPISPQQKHFVGDPRLCDPHLSKFFFRQRVTSKSRHPSVHHHCSLRTPDPQVCSKYRCTGAGTVIQTRRTLTATTNVPSHCVTSAITAEDGEDLEPLQADEEDATSFDDFDFFHPRHQTGSTVRDVKTSTNTPINRNATGQPSRGTTSPDEAPMIDQHLEGEINPLDIDTKQMDKQPDCQRATTSSSRKRNQAGKESVSSAPKSLTSELTAEPEVYHPSDCSLAPSTSSSCSSD